MLKNIVKLLNRSYTYDVIHEKTNRSKSTINNVIKKEENIYKKTW